MRNQVCIIRVDFPALTDLIAYWKEKDDSQRQIDALTTEVEKLTTRLNQSQVDLQGSIYNPTKEK